MIEAPTKDELWSIFERGSENRHVASTSERKNLFPQYSKNTESHSIIVLMYHQMFGTKIRRHMEFIVFFLVLK